MKQKKRFIDLLHHEYLNRRFLVGLLDDTIYKERIKKIDDELLSETLSLNKSADRGREMYAFYLIYNDRLFVDELFPLRKYQFENVEFYGPNNADALLSRCYGDYMKLPPIGKRHPHYAGVVFF